MNFSKQIITTITSSALCISLVSCGDSKKETGAETSSTKEKPIMKSHEVIMQEEVNAYQELSDALTQIKDIESAKATIPNLTEIGFKFNRLKTDFENAKEISPTDLKKITDNFKPERDKLTKTIGIQLEQIRATSPQAFSIISNVMRGITQ